MAQGALLPIIIAGAGAGAGALSTWMKYRMSDPELRRMLKTAYAEDFTRYRDLAQLDIGRQLRLRAFEGLGINPYAFWLGLGYNPTAQVLYALLASRIGGL